jgi:hypothetical protein
VLFAFVVVGNPEFDPLENVLLPTYFFSRLGQLNLTLDGGQTREDLLITYSFPAIALGKENYG